MTMRTTIANAKMPSFSRGVCPLTVAMEVAQKIEGPGDEHGAVVPGELQRPQPCGVWVRHRLDAAEEAPAGLGELLPRHRPSVRRLRRHQRIADDGERLEHRLRPLVVEDGRDHDEPPVGKTREEIADSGEVVGAVPDLERTLAAVLEAPGEIDLVRGRRL